MAYYKVLELSFIGVALCQEGAVVDINDNPKKGGMTPGANLAACDADGNLTAAKSARSKQVDAEEAPADAPAEEAPADAPAEDGQALA